MSDDDPVEIWRDSGLEKLLGASLDDTGITEASFTRLVDVGAREGDQMDFKSKPYGFGASRGDWSAEQDFSKDVCQFANHRGGLLLIGVEESAEVATKVAPVSGDPEVTAQQMRAALANCTSPVPRVDIVVVTAAAGGFYLAVVVPPSPLSPHAVTSRSGKRPLHFAVRDGAAARWMGETEVADRYHGRGRVAASRAAHLDRVVDLGLEPVGRSRGAWIYVAVVPEAPVPSRLDQSTLAEIADWWRAYGFTSPLRRSLSAGGPVVAAPGRVTVATDPWYVPPGLDALDPHVGYLELWADGAAFAAKSVMAGTGAHSAEQHVGDRTMTNDALICSDAVLSWVAHRAGAFGVAEVEVGLALRGERGAVVSPPLELVGGSDFGLQRVDGTRLLHRSPSSRLSADLTEAVSPQGRLATTYLVLTTLLQHFGVAETTALDPDGTVRIQGWGYRHRHEIAQWAEACDLAHRDA